jgi:hypothetical protein
MENYFASLADSNAQSNDDTEQNTINTNPPLENPATSATITNGITKPDNKTLLEFKLLSEQLTTVGQWIPQKSLVECCSFVSGLKSTNRHAMNTLYGTTRYSCCVGDENGLGGTMYQHLEWKPENASQVFDIAKFMKSVAGMTSIFSHFVTCKCIYFAELVRLKMTFFCINTFTRETHGVHRRLIISSANRWVGLHCRTSRFQSV